MLISAKSAVGSGRPPVGALGGGISVEGGGGGGAPGGGGGGGPPLGGGGGAEETEVSSVPYKKITRHGTKIITHIKNTKLIGRVLWCLDIHVQD